MELWLLLILILLSLMTYSTIKRSVEKITTTPVWLLWLVIMTPAWLWTIWSVIFPEQNPPLLLVIIPFIACPLLYWWLINKGKIKAEVSPEKDKENVDPVSILHTLKTPVKTPEVRPITSDEELALKNCFPWDVYYLQKIDYRPQAILCTGKLRSIPTEAYHKIKDNIEHLFGDRFLVLFQESLQGQPFFALVPNPFAKSNKEAQSPIFQENTKQPGLALTLLLITLFTTTVIGVEISGITAEQLQGDPNLLLTGLPYSLGLIAILGLHELSHYFTAVYYKIRTTLPYFIPIPFFLGTFGAFISLRSPVPHRKALFDVAIAGPIGGFLITLPLLFWGLSLSKVVEITQESHLLSFQSLDPRFSLLFGVISKLTLGDQLVSGMAINLHPLAVAGYIGLIVTALNLMPVGQLDGGHIVHGMFGQRTAIAVGWISRWLILLISLVQSAFFLWAILLFFMPIVDQPALDDVTELDNFRDFLGLSVLTLLVSIILPMPNFLVQLLNL
jgi:membrane-associated protease RseP (regulator of RpoE activity)